MRLRSTSSTSSWWSPRRPDRANARTRRCACIESTDGVLHNTYSRGSPAACADSVSRVGSRSTPAIAIAVHPWRDNASKMRPIGTRSACAQHITTSMERSARTGSASGASKNAAGTSGTTDSTRQPAPSSCGRSSCSIETGLGTALTIHLVVLRERAGQVQSRPKVRSERPAWGLFARDLRHRCDGSTRGTWKCPLAPRCG